MANLCPECAQVTIGALKHFDRCTSDNTINCILHSCTKRCSRECNKAAWRLRTMNCLNIKALRQETGRQIEITGKMPVKILLAKYLRHLAFCSESVPALQWLYKNFSNDFSVSELIKLLRMSYRPGQLQCYLYLQAWGCARNFRIPFEPHLLRKHCAAKIIQRRWRKAVANPAFAVCRNRLLTEFTECGKWVEKVMYA